MQITTIKADWAIFQWLFNQLKLQNLYTNHFDDSVIKVVEVTHHVNLTSIKKKKEQLPVVFAELTITLPYPDFASLISFVLT